MSEGAALRTVTVARPTGQFRMSDDPRHIGEWPETEFGNGRSKNGDRRCVHRRGEMQRRGVVRDEQGGAPNELRRRKQRELSCRIDHLGVRRRADFRGKRAVPLGPDDDDSRMRRQLAGKLCVERPALRCPHTARCKRNQWPLAVILRERSDRGIAFFLGWCTALGRKRSLASLRMTAGAALRMTSGASLTRTSEESVDIITLVTPWIEARTQLRPRELLKRIACAERQQPRRVMSVLYRRDATRVKRPPGRRSEPNPLGNARHECERATSNTPARDRRRRSAAPGAFPQVEESRPRLARIRACRTR